MNELPKRKQIRLQNYDYSQNGYYFITICTHNRQNLFGVIGDGKIKLNGVGNIVDFTWNDLQNHNDIKLHQYVIMPDHIHGIIEICDGYRRICRERSATVPKMSATVPKMSATVPKMSETVPKTSNYHYGIPEIIRQFKTFSSKRINEFLKRNGYEPFPTGALWQKSYYEHIIRDENDYIRTAEYILNNPLKWEMERTEQNE